MEKLLKLDPGNTELLGRAVLETKEKLETLKTAAEQANTAFANGEISQEQYDAPQRKLESPYTLLFLCYVYEENYAKAKAFFEDISTKLAGFDMVMISGSLLRVNDKASGKMDEIRQMQQGIRRQLKEASRENQEQKQLMRQWTVILAQCQLADEGQEVSTQYWEEQLAEQYVIEQTGKRKSLFRFLDDIVVTQFRNKSAHKAHKEVLKRSLT